MSADITARPARIDDDVLAGIATYNDAAAALAAVNATIDDFADYGTGFNVVDKSALVNVAFLAISWAFNEGDNGEFVSVEALTANNEKVVFNDGSTGVMEQLKSVTARRLANGSAAPSMGLRCSKGLTSKTYDRKNEDGSIMLEKGKPVKATTYRIAV